MFKWGKVTLIKYFKIFIIAKQKYAYGIADVFWYIRLYPILVTWILTTHDKHNYGYQITSGIHNYTISVCRMWFVIHSCDVTLSQSILQNVLIFSLLSVEECTGILHHSLMQEVSSLMEFVLGNWRKCSWIKLGEPFLTSVEMSYLSKIT